MGNSSKYDITSDEGNRQQPGRPLPHYACDVKRAAKIFAQSGFRVAPRTITSYCCSNLLDCEKFINGNVTRWKITRESIDARIETLKREGFPLASSNQLQPAGMPAGNSEQKPAEVGDPTTEVLGVLKDELKEKNKQISEYQAIIHTQNKQFENLNQTIQLSNQTIQQLNSVLALPKLKDYIQSTGSNANPNYNYEVPVSNPSTETDDQENDELDLVENDG